MSKTRIFALSVIILMLAAVFTNPTKEQHEEAVKAKVLTLLQAAPTEKNSDAINFGIQLFGGTLIDQFLNEHIKVDNFYLFSLTKVRWENQETIIGGGAFKQIWLSPKIDEKAEEIVQIIKGR
ncbi:uncharacterized protein DUF4359 [Sphingobacterium allocomposti]|jgi:uncharacterized membrane protein|uniref:Uncharacterized protein DUF4359 n=1 Tax=Sphingobacterium allocomposti TaxID=415956 RepID=A0A5S5D6Y9_9SPHI|nr:DUF4359 domain-containing protein [Sphingobacterium composti Yoo et al. 2007 non Ten et al. 2007]TYP91760.1 uncharacterized protein DUF4359 [Sphingobacterium composti Yoo et al. 2007 non Ten et al. 2007]HLS93942.1 DUF4359 domain-containing protein [Sphingobacterium sp.]